jgi:hypothetical protein
MFAGALSMRPVNTRMQDAVNVQQSMGRFMDINQKATGMRVHRRVDDCGSVQG